MVKELREDNILARVIDSIRKESRAVTIAGISLVVAFLSLLMAWISVDAAKTAEIRSEMQTEKIQEMELKIQTQDAKLYNLHKTINEKEL